MPLSDLFGGVATFGDLLSLYDERFVRAAYQIVLDRAPNSQELRYCLAKMQRGIEKVAILAELHLSTEGESRRNKIRSLIDSIGAYTRAKVPSAGSFLRFTGKATKDTFSDIDEMLYAAYPISRQRFVDEQLRFVHSAYHVLLGRVPDLDGLRFYLESLRSGVPKVEILAQLHNSTEGRSRKAETTKLAKAVKVHQQLNSSFLGALLRLAGKNSADRSQMEYARAIDNKLHCVYEVSISIQEQFRAVEKKLNGLEAANNAKQQSTSVIENAIEVHRADLQKQLADLRLSIGEISRATTPGVDAPGMDEFQHPGDLASYYFDRVQQSGLFDAEWYLKQYAEEYRIKTDPLSHYLAVGVRDGLNPSPQFDTKFYIENNPDVLLSDLHPFVHFVVQGRSESRNVLPSAPADYVSRYAAAAPEFIPRSAADAGPVPTAVRVICFYLPQYHPIPENDAWWGQGFTEWSNVKPALPQFDGHYQPHVPDEYLGHYNLLDRGIQAKQIDLARQYGIGGFCYYLYWFSGHQLLEQPIDNYLDDTTLDFPFCVCWANENWSRRWDGLDSDLLIAQHYSEADDIDFISNVAKYLGDSRYIRVAGKPLLLVYRPNLFPSMKATSERWRGWCRQNGIGEIYLAYPQSFEQVDPANYGFDAAIEFPPNNSAPPNVTRSVVPIVNDFQSVVYDWRVFVERSDEYKEPAYKLFRGTCTSWDNTARKKNKGIVFINSCPKLFTRWLTNAFVDTRTRFERPDEQLVFVNAWNEWAEGAHLEPDQRHGYAWLQAVRDAHVTALGKRKRILIVGHDALPHGAQILCLNIAKYFKTYFKFDVDLIVLGEGSLLAKYAEYATVHRLDLTAASHQDILQLVSSLREKGTNAALVNTTVSGLIIPYLDECGFNVVSLVHEMAGILNGYALQEHASIIARFARKVVFPALQVQKSFEGFLAASVKQAVVRPQGLFHPSLLRSGANKDHIRVAVRVRLGLPAEAKLIMCLGYADHRKGFDLFVHACQKIFESMPDSYALWVGHHHESFVGRSMTAVSDASYRDRFIFTGLEYHPEEYYLAADVFALTSREDPFPCVVMEALDALTPVVAFQGVGGFDNLLKRDCGILVPGGDIQAFAAATISLLRDPKKARDLAVTGQRIVETEFNFQHYLFDLLEFADQPLPKVSVVVPNYKYERHIRHRLESIANQNFPIYELIVLDDASPDRSVDVITEFLKTCEVPHRLLVNEKNSGSVFRQWRKGAELARGDFVWIAEADDLAEASLLEKLVPLFNDKDVVLAYCQSKQIDESGEVLSGDYQEYTSDVGDFWKEDYVCDGIEEIKRALCIKNTIPNVSAVLFRRDALISALDEIGDAIFDYKVAGDWLVYLHMASKGKVCFLASALNHHRRHSESVTKRSNHSEEVTSLQIVASRFADIPKRSTEKARRYIEFLREHFGQQMSDQVRVVLGHLSNDVTPGTPAARAVAFYLPQFHPFAENDAWWGKGFTEWTNVTKAKPLFDGHYQPHLPADLGFYDLRLAESRQAQADLARQFGIEGFCYWHYWFNGKRLLERPFNEVLESKAPNFPFCLAWANETWSRRWLGEPKDVLMDQTYSDEDDLNHVRWLIGVFADDRYMKVNNRPMFLIYRPSGLPNPQRTTDLFRQECLKSGISDPYLIGVNGHDVNLDTRKIGFDATLHFTPQLGILPDAFEDGPFASKFDRNLRLGVRSDVLKIYDYKDSLNAMLALRKTMTHPTIPSIFVGWDNTPRRSEKAIILTNSDPEFYKEKLSSLIDEQCTKSFTERLVFINAWNEWAEGNHLEPDTQRGHRFLEATRSALCPTKTSD